MTEIRGRVLRYSAIAVLVLAGAMSLAPRVTQAYYGGVGSCAAATAATSLGTLDLQVQGATSYALPVWTTSGISSTTTAQDYGYLPYVSGLSAPYQSAGSNNAGAAMFTFSANTTAITDTIVEWPFVSSAHTGTVTIYAVTGQAPTFSMPASFQSGTAVLTATYTVVNSGQAASGVYGMPAGRTAYMQAGIGPDFTGFGSAVVTSVTPFSLDGTCYQLGATGTSFKMSNAGHLAGPSVINGAFWGTWSS